jgi:hypothetical protein
VKIAAGHEPAPTTDAILVLTDEDGVCVRTNGIANIKYDLDFRNKDFGIAAA